MATKKTPTKTAAAKRTRATKAAAPKTTATKTTATKTTATKTAASRKAAPKAVAKKPVAAKVAAPKAVAPKAVKAKAAEDLAAPLFAFDSVEEMAPLAEEAMKPVEAAVAAGKETLEAVVKAGTQAATKGYEQAVAMTQEQVEKASSNVFKGYDEVASLGRDNMDAYVESTEAMARGFESLGKEFISFTQVSMEAGMAAARSLATAKSLGEMIELQRDYSRSSFDTLLTESAKLTDLSIALANEAMEPLQSRVTVTVEKIMKPLAA